LLHLSGKARPKLSVTVAEAYTVIVLGSVRALFILGLELEDTVDTDLARTVIGAENGVDFVTSLRHCFVPSLYLLRLVYSRGLNLALRAKGKAPEGA